MYGKCVLVRVYARYPGAKKGQQKGVGACPTAQIYDPRLRLRSEKVSNGMRESPGKVVPKKGPSPEPKQACLTIISGQIIFFVLGKKIFLQFFTEVAIPSPNILLRDLCTLFGYEKFLVHDSLQEKIPHFQALDG